MDQWDFFKDLFPNHDDNVYLLNIGEEVNDTLQDNLLNITQGSYKALMCTTQLPAFEGKMCQIFDC